MATITFTKALEGYALHVRARQLSPHTVSDYWHTFAQFVQFLDGADTPLLDISKQTLTRFFASLADDGLSRKTVRNAHAGLSALWTWAVDEGIVEHNLLHDVRTPKPEVRDIAPFSQTDLRALLHTASQTRQPLRNRAIILVLVDTCVRASELCNLTLCDCDLRNQRIHVEHGKGDKSRFVPFVADTGKAVWRYIATRDEPRPDDPLFATQRGRPLTRTELAHCLKRIGARAGVDDVHAHRFRHTGAIMHLANGAPVVMVQEMLGHSTLQMTRHYLNASALDVARIHQKTSPVANWRL